MPDLSRLDAHLRPHLEVSECGAVSITSLPDYRFMALAMSYNLMNFITIARIVTALQAKHGFRIELRSRGIRVHPKITHAPDDLLTKDGLFHRELSRYHINASDLLYGRGDKGDTISAEALVGAWQVGVEAYRESKKADPVIRFKLDNTARDQHPEATTDLFVPSSQYAYVLTLLATATNEHPDVDRIMHVNSKPSELWDALQGRVTMLAGPYADAPRYQVYLDTSGEGNTHSIPRPRKFRQLVLTVTDRTHASLKPLPKPIDWFEMMGTRPRSITDFKKVQGVTRWPTISNGPIAAGHSGTSTSSETGDSHGQTGSPPSAADRSTTPVVPLKTDTNPSIEIDAETILDVDGDVSMSDVEPPGMSDNAPGDPSEEDREMDKAMEAAQCSGPSASAAPVSRTALKNLGTNMIKNGEEVMAGFEEASESNKKVNQHRTNVHAPTDISTANSETATTSRPRRASTKRSYAPPSYNGDPFEDDGDVVMEEGDDEVDCGYGEKQSQKSKKSKKSKRSKKSKKA